MRPTRSHGVARRGNAELFGLRRRAPFPGSRHHGRRGIGRSRRGARLGARITLKPARTAGFGRMWDTFRGEIRFTGKSGHWNAKDQDTVVEVRPFKTQSTYDIGVEDDPHLYALATGILTHNSKDNATPSGVKDRCVSAHEYIFLLSKSKTYYFDNDALREPSVTEEGGWRKPRSVWCFPTTPSSLGHHAQFPLELPRRCIVAATRPGDLVLDVFGGVGNTALAAQALGRRWLMIELVKKYADIIHERTRTQIGLAL